MSAVSSGGGSALIYKLDCPTHLQNDTFLTFLYSAQLQSPLASVSADLKAWQPSPPSLPSPLFLTDQFSLAAVLSDPALISPSFSNCDGYELVSSTAWHGGHTDNWSVNIGRIHTHTLQTRVNMNSTTEQSQTTCLCEKSNDAFCVMFLSEQIVCLMTDVQFNKQRRSA